MNTLIGRVFWILVSLLGLAAVLFIVMMEHTANIVEAAVTAGLSTAAVTSDTTAIQNAIVNNIQAALPISNGQFDPSSDITVADIEQNQEISVAVSYHMPIFGPLANVFGLGPTMTVSRGGTQALDYPHNGLGASLTSTPPSKIAVTLVTENISGQTVNMDVQGFGFGTPPSGVPGTTMGDFLTFQDTTQGWEAGPNTSGLAITYGSWQDNQITITGIQNFGKGTEVIRAGDECQIDLTTANGTAIYYFIANPSGETKYSTKLGWQSNSTSPINYSTAQPPTQTGVLLVASSAIPGDGTNGVGIYNVTTGQYLTWTPSGDTASYWVNSGTPDTDSYVSYYGPQGQISKALAVSDNLAATWTIDSHSVSAVMYPTSTNTWYIDLFGQDLTNCTVTGLGLSGQTQISSNEVEVQAASEQDLTGVVTLSDGTQVSFTAEDY